MSASHFLRGRSVNRRRARVMRSAIEPLEERVLFTAYYSNGNGTVNGTGTAASPWDSLYAISTYTGFQPGDTVYLSGTFSNQILFMGNAQRGVTLTSLTPNSPATISESSAYVFNNAITVSSAGVTISNINLVGPGISDSSNDNFYAIIFQNTGSVQFTGATVDHVTESGFVFAGLEVTGNTSGYTNVTVTNSNFSNNQVSGIVVDGTNTGVNGNIHQNVLISNCITSGNAGAAIYFNAHNNNTNENAGNGGILVSAINGAVVTHCTAIHNCYNSEGACGIWAHNCNNLIFEYSECADTRTQYAGFDGNGFDFDHDVNNSIMEYDYSHGNDGVGLYLCSFAGAAPSNNDTIRYCISDFDAQNHNHSVMIYADKTIGVTNANIYNNTILVSGTYSEGFAMGGSGTGSSLCTVNFLNNIIYTMQGSGTTVPAAIDLSDVASPSLAKIKIEGNDIYTAGVSTNFKMYWGGTNYSTLAAFAAATGQETLNGTIVGQNVDPKMVNETVSDLPIANVSNFALTAASALRGKALNLMATPFSNTAPYNTGSPTYNLGGTAWNGIGTQDYFGNLIGTGASPDIGAQENNILVLTGSSAGDTYNVTAGSVTVNSTVYPGILGVTINGSTGNENVTVDLSNGPVQLNFNGGTGTNTLTTKNTASGTSQIYFNPKGTANNLNIASGSVIVPANPQTGLRTVTFSNINITAGAKVTFANPITNQSNRTLVVVSTGLTLSGSTNAWTGLLDLGGNDLDVKAGNLTNLSNQVYQEWKSNWQGTGGITSSAVASDSTHLRTLGVIRNTVDGTTTGTILKTTFDSATAAASDILVKFTYVGDAQIGGTVDGTDYSRIDSAFVTGGMTGWYNGDFNYDGIINGSDYTLIDNAFNTQAASMAAEIAKPLVSRSAVPTSTFATSPAIVVDSFDDLRRHKTSHFLSVY